LANFSLFGMLYQEKSGNPALGDTVAASANGVRNKQPKHRNPST
jgi:hypothetical protein